jgi:hypothetical protein
MFAPIQRNLTFSNVIACLALFIALGGAAVAAGLAKNSVGTKQLKPNAVTAAKIKNGAVNAHKLAHGAVVAGKLGANSVAAGTLQNGSVIAAKLAQNSVTNSAIAGGVVGTSKLGNKVVTSAKMADNSVGTTALLNGSVTSAKLAPEFGPLLGTLKTGQTLRGTFDLGAEAKIVRGGESFQFPLVNPPAAPETNILEAAGTSTACPGLKGGNGQTPEAAAGQLCVYVKVKEGTGAALSFDANSVNRLGFGLSASFTNAEAKNQIQGFWAVTAP